jgi:uncharacterized protein with HXXEE motif
MLTQALHAVEEYFGRLWEVYTPAKFVCNLVASDPRTGFIIINTAFISFSLFYWLVFIKSKQASIPGFIWFWIVLEIVNITGHFSWAIYKRDYTPGVVTAFLLLLLVIYLLKQLLFSPRSVN